MLSKRTFASLASALLAAMALLSLTSGFAPDSAPGPEGSATAGSDGSSAFEYASAGVPREAFEAAMAGFYDVQGRKKDILTLIDFTLPSTARRLWVIDVAARRVLVSSHVAHGRGSGGNYATSFSNESGSHQSSLGFYLTAETYTGGNGYSLRLNGLSAENSNARARAIVVHGADYADPALAERQGRLGRSLGCPALPRTVARQIIDLTKEGSVMYIHGRSS